MDFPESRVTYPQAINNGGQIAGQYNTPAGHSRPFICIAGEIVTIDIPGAVSASALGINDRGQIAGNFIDANQVHHGFVAVLPL